MAGGGTSTEQSPWEGQAPYLSTGYEASYNQLLAGGPSYYGGSTVAGFAPQTEAGLGLLEQSATAGNPIAAAAGNHVTGLLDQTATDFGAGNFVQGQLGQQANSFQDYASQTAGGPQLSALGNLAETASGQFLNSNPHIDATYDAAARGLSRNFTENVSPAMAAQFSAAGRSGSGAHQEAFQRSADTLGTQLGELSANIYGQNYANERNNQLSSANAINNQQLAASQQDVSRLGIASGLYGQDQNQQLGAAQLGAGLQGQTLDAQGAATALASDTYDLSNADANQLLSVGSAVQNQGQAYLNDDVARHDFTQQQPYTNLNNYLANIQGNVGFSQTQSGSGSQLGSAAGGALTGYQVGGPYGALIGGALGYFGGGN